MTSSKAQAARLATCSGARVCGSFRRKRETITGMLPDLRFALGAVLALAVLGVAGLGVVTSVRLAREARIAPLNDSRSLAYAGQAELNQFYDPDSARRFGASRGSSESALPAPPRETPALSVPAPVPASALEQTASLPVNRPGIETKPARDAEPPPIASVPDAAPVMVERPPPEPEPAQPPETTVTVTIVPTDDAPPLPDPSQTSGPPAPAPDRVASLPVTTAEEDRPKKAAPAAPKPAAGNPASDPNFMPPIPRARPKLEFHRRLARARIPRPVAAPPQTTPTSPFGAWPNLPSTSTSASTNKAATR